MKTGKVKYFNESKGFGFIIDDATGEDVFVHVSGLVDKVNQEDTVEYEVVDGRKGKNAVNVKKVNSKI